MKSAVFKATGCGKMDANTQTIVNKATASTVRWQDELQVMAEDITKSDYVWTRPNVRFMQGGIYMPSMGGRKPVDMVFFVDTSGSLCDSQLQKIAGEAKEIVESFNVRVVMVYWDTQYKGMEIFEPADVLDPEWKLDVKGRGGTNFSKCWDWLEENQFDLDINPKAIVFFSDLECRCYPENEPQMPLIWCQVPDSGNSFNNSYIPYLPSYGKHVHIPVYK